MRQRSETWAKLAARGRFTVDVVAVIGGVTYTAISAPVIDRALLSDAMSVGNCISASMKVSVLTDDEISVAASVVIKARIKDGQTASEWLEFGTFYIDKREKNSGLVTLQCYDTMLKASQRYVDPSIPDDRIDWPKSMQTCVREIAQRIGVQIDPRTVINTADAYQVAYPTNYTMQQVLGYIGAAHGGNWIITPENKLRLVPLISPPAETFDIVDYYYNRIYTSDGYKLVWRHSETGEPANHPAGGDIINVPIVIGKITTGKSMTVSRVTIARDEKLGYTRGDDSGIELRINENPYANQAVCDGLYAAVNGTVYVPFTITNACYDPCTELGDWMLVGDQVRSVVYKQTLTFSTDFRADASAPGKDETSSEYPYLTEIEKLHLEDERLKVFMDEAKVEVDSQILQTRELITLEVTARQQLGDLVNTLDSRITLAEGNITAEITRAQNAETSLETRISLTEGKIDLKVTKGDISAQISVETGKVTIGANRLTINSDNFTLSGSGKVTANGSITTTSGDYSTKIDDGGVNMYYQGGKAGHLRSDGMAWDGEHYGDVVELQTDLDGLIIGSSYEYSFVYNNGLNTWGYNERFYLSDDLHVDGMIHTSNILQFYGDPTIDNHWGAHISGTYSSQGAEGVYVSGYLWVTDYMVVKGTKSRAVETENFGTVCLNAMESADAVFSDFGSATLDDTGVAYIYFDQIFIETVDLLHDYYVFTTRTSQKDISYVEKKSDHFIVHGEARATFDWIVYASQKDYTTERLENRFAFEVGNDKADPSIFYGDDKAAAASSNYMGEFKDTYDEQAEAYLNEYEQEVSE